MSSGGSGAPPKARANPKKTAAKAGAGARVRAPVRTRRTAEEARRIILDAAEPQLLANGPSSLRLQQVARAAGVSHPLVLHHFGSRQGLVREVVKRALGALRAELVDALSVTEGHDALDPLALVQRAFRTLIERGHARFWVWLVLSGETPPPEETWLHDVARAAHARREQLAQGAPVPPFEDTLFRTLLAALAVFGDAIVGRSLRISAGIASDAAGAQRFDAWLGGFLTSFLLEGGQRASSDGG